MKIGFVSAVGAEENTPLAEFIKQVDRLARNQVGRVKAEDTELVFQMPGSDEPPNDEEILRGYLEMARAGEYDAVISWCFLDPMKKEARQALEIPVIGIAETAMHMASMMGARFGVIAPDEPGGKETTDGYIRTLGLQDRAVPTRVLPYKNLWSALTDASEGIDAMIKAGRGLISDGAEVIIPGCVLIDVMAANAPGCEQEYPNGLKEIDGVPVINVAAYAVKFAETLAAMKKAGVPWISRKAPEQGVSATKYKGPGFWLD